MQDRTAADQAPTRAHYISGTHWDREWYRPFQEFRLLLVELMDQLLDLMETNSEFRYFHLDGQTCVLADYLRIRPEQRERLAALIRSGRILIGPWFTMPDLFCPGAEALVRNLLVGRRICRAWGVEPMPVAYTCDMFGHPGQMPAIYAGFGLPHCVLGRGTNESTTPSFFEWEAANGARVLCFKLQDQMGYGAFMGARTALDRADSEKTDAAEADAVCSLRDYVEHEVERSNVPVLCLIDALDHAPPAADAGRYLRILKQACPDVDAEHSNLPAFFAEAAARAGTVPVRRGELREPSQALGASYLWLIPNCVSARTTMKQANDRCQVLLEQWAEPFLAVAAVEGVAEPAGFLQEAWELLLLNHAHDSICGCSIDEVHRQMMARFEEVGTLGVQLARRAFGALTAAGTDLAEAEHEFTLTIANPLPWPRNEVVTFSVDLPLDYPATFQEGFRSQELKAFRLFRADGSELPYQRMALVPRFSERTRHAAMLQTGDGPCTKYTVAAELDLPALGYTSILVKPSDTPVRRSGSLRIGPCSAANAVLKIEIAPNGTLEVTDRRNGETYRDLLLGEDRSEIGDGWFHGETVNDEVCLSAGAAAQIAVVADGPDLVTFRITVPMSIPLEYDWHEERRSTAQTRLDLVHEVTLRRNAAAVDVETTVHNTAADHRLQLLLPTDCAEADAWLAHEAYGIARRPVALGPESAAGNEPDLAEKPFLGFQAIEDGNRGLAFLAAGGLHEGGVRDDERRTMQVTVLRSFRRTVFTEGERDGLQIGLFTVRYALMPYGGDLPRLRVLRELARLQAGTMTRQTGPLSSGYPAMAGRKPPCRSFLELESGALAVTAVKPAEAEQGRCIVRLWNPWEETREETVRFWLPVLDAKAVNLAETEATDVALRIAGPRVTVVAPAHDIVTISVALEQAEPDACARLRDVSS